MCRYKSDVACPVFPDPGRRHTYDRRARSANINNVRHSSIQGVDYPEAIQGFEMRQKAGIFPEAGFVSRKYCETQQFIGEASLVGFHCEVGATRGVGGIRRDRLHGFCIGDLLVAKEGARYRELGMERRV